ncbi:hypothetical protein D3C77_317800 [compost metagenome]
MVDVHHPPILAVQPPLVFLAQGHLHSAFSDAPFLLAVPDVLCAVDVHIAFYRVHLQRRAFFGRQTPRLVQLLDLLRRDQLLVGPLHPFLRERLANQGFETGPLHRLTLVEVPHVSGALDQGEPPHRSVDVQTITPRAPLA